MVAVWAAAIAWGRMRWFENDRSAEPSCYDHIRCTGRRPIADGLRFDASVRVEDAGAAATTLAFTNGFRGSEPGAAVARGRVKFGMCQGESERCVIVQRDLELPIAIDLPD